MPAAKNRSCARIRSEAEGLIGTLKAEYMPRGRSGDVNQEKWDNSPKSCVEAVPSLRIAAPNSKNILPLWELGYLIWPLRRPRERPEKSNGLSGPGNLANTGLTRTDAESNGRRQEPMIWGFYPLAKRE